MEKVRIVTYLESDKISEIAEQGVREGHKESPFFRLLILKGWEAHKNELSAKNDR